MAATLVETGDGHRRSLRAEIALAAGLASSRRRRRLMRNPTLFASELAASRPAPHERRRTWHEPGWATAKTLAEALPYIQIYDRETVVIKYGGHAMGEERWPSCSPPTPCC